METRGPGERRQAERPGADLEGNRQTIRQGKEHSTQVLGLLQKNWEDKIMTNTLIVCATIVALVLITTVAKTVENMQTFKYTLKKMKDDEKNRRA